MERLSYDISFTPGRSFGYRDSGVCQNTLMLNYVL